jgi:NADH:ubiquinone oxidoreductase subunit H
MGLLQPFADGLKLFIKEIDSTKSNTNLFLFAPMIFLARPCELVNNALSINSVMQI